MLGGSERMLSNWQSCFLKVSNMEGRPWRKANDSTWIPIRFFVEGCHPESETQQATSPGFQTWITKEWCHHGTQLELSTLDFHIISDSGDGLL